MVPPSFSTTVGKNPDKFKCVLVTAGFSPISLNDILYGQQLLCSELKNGDIYHNIKLLTETTRDEDGRTPLCIAAARSLKWADMKLVFAANMPAIYQIDVITGLPIFMLSAVGPASNMESIYNLLKELPSVIDNYATMK